MTQTTFTPCAYRLEQYDHAWHPIGWERTDYDEDIVWTAEVAAEIAAENADPDCAWRVTFGGRVLREHGTNGAECLAVEHGRREDGDPCRCQDCQADARDHAAHYIGDHQ